MSKHINLETRDTTSRELYRVRYQYARQATKDKKILILGFSSDLGIFFNAVVKTLQQRGVQARLVGELAAWYRVPKNFQVPRDLLNKITSHDQAFYNPHNSMGLHLQINNYATRCLYHLGKILDEYQPTDLVVWNGALLFTQAAIHLAEQRNIRIWYMENGAIPGTLQLDSKGINYASSITGQDKQFFLNADLDFNSTIELSNPLLRSRGFTSKFETSARYLNHFGGWFFTHIFWSNFIPDQIGKSLRKNFKPEESELPNKFIFVPLQVQDDTQIMMHSPLIKNMKQLVETCYTAIKQVDSNLKMVVKEHPQDFGRHSYEDLRKKYPDIIWLKKHPIDDLLEKASVVVVVNSGTGVEALMKNKPVITLGQAFYNVPGVVQHAETLDSLPHLIQQSLIRPADAHTISKFLGYLQKHHLILGGWKKFSQKTLETIADRLTKSEAL